MKTEITASALSVLIVGALILGGVTIFDDDVYYCEARNIVMPCDSLSKYYSLPNGKCRNSELGNKLCRSGWLKVTQDIELNITISDYDFKQEKCDFIGCTPV